MKIAQAMAIAVMIMPTNQAAALLVRFDSISHSGTLAAPAMK